MEGIKKLFVFFRNALAFSFAWLVLCTAVISLAGGKEISAVFLLKILALCAWGSLSFVFSFFTKFMKKKGFIFCLTIFFLLFIPVEILMFSLCVSVPKSTQISSWSTPKGKLNRTLTWCDLS